MFKKLLMPFMKENAQSLTPRDVSELIELLINNYNDPNNILIPLANNQYRVINADDILYIHHPKKGTITIALEEENLSYKNTAFDVMEFLEGTNKNFSFLDNGLLVNIRQIVNYHSYFRKIYFKNGTNVVVTGAAMNNIIIKRFGKEIDLYQNSELKRQVEIY